MRVFITSKKCMQVILDSEIDRRVDRVEYKNREEKCY
jgi:hypothetical protein